MSNFLKKSKDYCYDMIFEVILTYNFIYLVLSYLLLNNYISLKTCIGVVLMVYFMENGRE